MITPTIYVQLYISLPSIHDYWKTELEGVFLALNVARYMSKERFFQINRSLKVAQTECEEQEIRVIIVLQQHLRSLKA